MAFSYLFLRLRDFIQALRLSSFNIVSCKKTALF